MNLRVDHLSFSYRPEIPVLQDISLELVPGQVTAIFGSNGSGKSTLLRCLNGSLQPQKGSIQLDHQEIASLSPRQIARSIAVVAQENPRNLYMTVEEMVILGRFPHWGLWRQESQDDWEIVKSSLVRLNALSLINRPVNQLSGGEYQRVIIARALAQQTPVILLDEPSTHLDIAHQLELYHFLKTLAAEGKTILMICHDLFLAPKFIDHSFLLKSGRIVGSGPPATVLTNENLSNALDISLNLSLNLNLGLIWQD